MSITSLSCANRPWIKYRRFLFLLYCTALFLTGWWIGWVLLLLIVPAGGRLDIFERERRMRMGQHTIKLIGCQTNLESNPRRGIGRHCTVHRLISSPIAAICFFDTPTAPPKAASPVRYLLSSSVGLLLVPVLLWQREDAGFAQPLEIIHDRITQL